MVKYGTVIIYYAFMTIALASYISIYWAALDCHKKEINFQKNILLSKLKSHLSNPLCSGGEYYTTRKDGKTQEDKNVAGVARLNTAV